MTARTEKGNAYCGFTVAAGSFKPVVDAQTTTYVYGTAVADTSPAVYRTDLVRAIIYGDSTNTFDPVTGTFGGGDYNRVQYTYDRQGEMTAMTDQAGTTHAYGYDGVGRLLADSITAFGAGVDQTVKSLQYKYKVCGKLLSVSSYDTTDTSGNILNQVYYGYDSDGLLTTEYQEQSGAVNTATSLSVQYGHAGKDLGYRPTSFAPPRAIADN